MSVTKREKEILDFLWTIGPSFVKEIVASFDPPVPHYNTISTMVRNLEAKGFVDHEDFGTTFRYYAKVSQEDYVKRNLKKDVQRYFNNSYKSLVSSLVESNDLSIEEIQELMELAKNKKK